MNKVGFTDSQAMHGVASLPALEFEVIAQKAVEIFEHELRLNHVTHYQADKESRLGTSVEVDGVPMVLDHVEWEKETWTSYEMKVPLDVFAHYHLNTRMACLAERVKKALPSAPQAIAHGQQFLPGGIGQVVNVKGDHFYLRAIRCYDINYDSFITHFSILFGAK